jgi:hypothetical protein
MQLFGHCTFLKALVKCSVLLVRYILEYNPYCRIFILIGADCLCDVMYRYVAGQVYFKKIVSL